MRKKFISGALRLSLGFIFLWAFIDKLFGLGFATSGEKAWINGGSPTAGYLSYGTKGPLADYFHSLSGLAIVDWLFMLGLLFVGLTLITKKYLKWGSYAGVLMMALIYLSAFPPANNPFMDEHIIYALLFLLLAHTERD